MTHPNFLQNPEIDQVGMVVPDAVSAAEELYRILGIGPFRVVEWPVEGVDPEATYRGQPGSFRIRVAFAQVGPMQLELVEPLEGDSIWSEFLQQHGPGLHHVRLSLLDFESVVAGLEAMGLEKVCSGTGFHVGTRWAYFDTSHLLNGLVVEIRRKADQQMGEGEWLTDGRSVGTSTL
jgi:hypothetical protein